MEKIIIEKIVRVTKNRKKLEEKLGVRIENRGKEVFVSGGAEDEYIAVKVIEALEFGFPFSTAILLTSEDFMFEILNIKDHTTRKDLTRVRARIIGKEGKTLKTLSNLTKCFFELKDNRVGIIGDPEYMKNAEESVVLLIKGSKHSNVYSHLEKNQVQPVLDLGLREEKSRKNNF
ncbi:MAG: hypothetical protein KJ905_01965 [Nanoarchaeota archaeon]|nr:hypothetical protein [Nanoarchaeota archaeon]MBU1501520.1 hypothetical protein [Nanoarchaeota archaeon]MBU2459446.1 hypothetical protein [Nanoarchaeota archaeon]